jgi:phosphoserine phosphatase
MDATLTSWEETPTRRAIEAFVADALSLPAEERVAVFDNDGTLWSEKPMPTQLHFLVELWASAARADPALARQQPYLSALSGDYAWLSGAVDRHYAGDDSGLQLVLSAILAASGGQSVEDYEAAVSRFYREARHLTTGNSYSTSVYQPMVELLRYLEGNGFTCYIVSGGGRDFMRPITVAYYGIPPERVIGSSLGLYYDEASNMVRYDSRLALFDDGPEKPVRIWTRIGRRPLLAVGNSDGDIPMLRYAQNNGPTAAPSLSLLVHHDDPERGDPPYDTGAERALSNRDELGITVISVRDDWRRVFVAP